MMAQVQRLSVGGAVAWDRVRLVASRAVLALLLAYHAGLLAMHVADGRLLHPATSVRWLVGAFLFGGFLALRRLGVPLLWGRKAVVLWLLVVLLHGHAALSPPVPGDDWAATPASLAVFTAEFIGTLAVVFGLGFIATLRRASSGGLRQPGWRYFAVLAGQAARSGFLLVCSPRPPPSA